MRTVGEVINRSQNEQTRQQGQRSYGHSDKVFIYIWRGLQAAKFITKDDVVDGTDYKYWREMLKDVDDEGLLRGLRNSRDFTGYMTWSEFRKLCEPETKEPCHTMYLPPPVSKKMTPEQRKEACRKMKLETGVGV